MHPVLSDLTMHIVNAEIRAKIEAQERHRLARQASSRVSTIGRLSRLTTVVANAVRQRMDPHGYAMSLVEQCVVSEPILQPSLGTRVPTQAAPETGQPIRAVTPRGRRCGSRRRRGACSGRGQRAALAEDAATAVA